MESASLSWDSFAPKSIINRLPIGRQIPGYANFFATAGKPSKKLAAENDAENSAGRRKKFRLAGCACYFY